MKIGIIVPQLEIYRERYFELGARFSKKGHECTFYTEDFQSVYSLSVNLPQDDLDVCICGDPELLPHLIKSKATVKVINVLFPLFSSFLIGDYTNYISRDDVIVIGNGSEWSGLLGERHNWHTIPGAVNLEIYKPADIIRNDNKFRILFAVENTLGENLDKIIEAFHAYKDHEDFEWYYFGADPDVSLPDEFVGYTSIPGGSRLYPQVDCFISMSELTTWQSHVAEAMACRIPVITTQAGSFDFAINNNTAIVVEDVEGLIKGLLILKKSANMRRRLAKAGYEIIQNFSWDICTDTWITLLEAALKDNLIPIGNVIHEVIDCPICTEGEATPIQIEEPQDKQAAAISARAEELRKAYFLTRRPTTIIFDKYEKHGPYRWKDAQTNGSYKDYVDLVKKIFKGIADFYGIAEVLDVGGGDGYIAGQLSKLGFPVRLIDVNETALQLARTKLKDYSNIIIEHKDFFDLTLLSPYMIISFVIEHWIQSVDSIIEKVRKYKPDLILISSPIRKEFGLWDPEYHMQEYTEDDFINMFSPLIDEYMISHTTLRPFTQLLFFERKTTSIERYFRNLIDQTIDEGIFEQILKTISDIYSLEVKRNT
jgi:hypothetical protein